MCIDATRFETPEILKKVAQAARSLAELKGVAASIPNQLILVSSLGMQEAKDSSEIENIVTTHDELFRDAASPHRTMSAASKEVFRYRQALSTGFELVKKHRILSSNHIIGIQGELEKTRAGFRKLPGTALRDSSGVVVYSPPQDAEEIKRLMGELEGFVNADPPYPADALIRMALIHHQFESIHPFYDGNGRTGRILNVLYLVKEGLLDTPVLYMSRYIVRTKSEYYRLLQKVREDDAWEDWIIYMLAAVEETAREAVVVVEEIRNALMSVKHQVRQGFNFYSQDLINHLFSYPYTTIALLMRDMKVSRVTAVKYLNQLSDAGILTKDKVGKSYFFVNTQLIQILTTK